jgi:hypothetical protein
MRERRVRKIGGGEDKMLEEKIRIGLRFFFSVAMIFTGRSHKVPPAKIIFFPGGPLRWPAWKN